LTSPVVAYAGSFWWGYYVSASQMVYRSVSSGLGESDDLSVLPETFPAQQQVVLADQTDLALASSALSAVLSEFTGVGSPEQVGHLWIKLK
jgi:hypothetical protein